ncbi:MAG: YafY family transcriptional regulator [Thiotrichaceae bacterium]|nr:YafY family transcriptional regulator [Thiotrichaceae bacterium]PCI13549.1 MAG: DNA-binding transcriptional regulator [Thiotrichales bacterium]
MRRADRLFQIIQLLRKDRVVTAREIAEKLEVSERTIYRDMQDLSLSGVPISSEAGSGYRMLPGFHLPPLMFTEDELSALLIGARMVQVWTDKGLASAATQAMIKIESAVPEHMRDELERQDILVPDFGNDPSVSKRMQLLRVGIKALQKVEFSYKREDGQPSSRMVHPLGLFYWGKVWTLTAWCELRDEFRCFRLDRMTHVSLLEDGYESVAGRTLQDYLQRVCDE